MNLRRLLIPVATLFFLLFCTACDKLKDGSSPVLLRIDQRTVTLEEFIAYSDKALPPDQVLSDEERQELQRSALVEVIDRELTLNEAERLGQVVTPQEVETALAEHRRDYPDDAFEQMLRDKGVTLAQWRQELEKTLLMEKVLLHSVYRDLEVAEEEVERYYQENRNEFDRPEQVRARQIVVASQEQGQEVLAHLEQGMTFEEAARRYSLSPDGEEGGDLGFFARGQMPPEFDEVVFTLPVGEISPLVQSEYGYHLFLVDERRQSKHLDLDEVREEIRAQMRTHMEEQAYQQWLQGLREKAVIEVDWSLL